MVALSSGRNDWYRIRNQGVGNNQLHIYDEIGYFGVTAADLIRDLADLEGPLDVHLNSPGGEVFDGIAIYNTLLAREDVNVYVDGIAASIASVIAMAGKKVFIAPSAQIMVHNAFAMACGDAQDMREMADRLDANTANIAEIYAVHTGKPATFWRGVMDKETWYVGQEAVDAGLADSVVNIGRVPEGMKAQFDLGPLRQGRMAARGTTPDSPDNAAHHPYQGRHDIHHEPITGTHSHNHAEFGFGDGDDGIHAHAHTHDSDANHGHEHMAHAHQHGRDEQHDHAHAVGHEHYDTADHMHTHHVCDPDHDGDDDSQPDDGHGHGDTDHDYVPSTMHSAGYDDTAWDGSAALKGCHSAADFRRVCAGERSDGEPDERSHWALPHHKHPGSPANRHGVEAALGALNGSRGATMSDLKNRDAAEAHLKAHQRAWASESEASDAADTAIYSEADAAALVASLKG
jgi:ATP-dependent protease ClpP protease subunit